MLIIGANLGATSYGKRLPDGSLSVLRDEKVEFAAAEERFSRTKCDGGFDLAFEAYLKRWKRKRSDIELFVFSSCCDELGRAPIPGGVAVERVVFCSHHLSHALGSFVWSNFDEAIAIVIDSGGDNLEPLKAGQWWRSAREQHSFFHLTQKKHRLIGRHADGRGEAGFGELFRAFTYYLGWHGARYAGNTMALSGFGDSDALQRLHLFDIDNERFASHIDNDPNRPIEIVQTFLERSNLSGFKPRPARGPFERYHFDLASLIQRELERYLETVIRNLVRSTGVSNVILSGGVAYNCLAVGRLREKLQNIELFVQPASGDIGQGFGNACYGFFLTDGRTPFFEERKSDLGMRYRKRRYDPAKMVGGAFVTATADSDSPCSQGS